MTLIRWHVKWKYLGICIQENLIAPWNFELAGWLLWSVNLWNTDWNCECHFCTMNSVPGIKLIQLMTAFNSGIKLKEILTNLREHLILHVVLINGPCGKIFISWCHSEFLLTCVRWMCFAKVIDYSSLFAILSFVSSLEHIEQRHICT